MTSAPRTETPRLDLELDGEVHVEGSRHVVRFTRRYPVSSERLWTDLTQADRLAGWLGVVERLDLRAGGELVVLLNPSRGAWLRSEIIFVEPPTLLELTWRVPAHDGVSDFDGGTLRLGVHEDGDHARLSFAHALPDADRVLDILTASHLRLNLLPTQPGQTAHVDRDTFLAMRARYMVRETGG